MLPRVASTVMGRSWAFAAAAAGLVVSLAIATAPKPSCKCTGVRPSAPLEDSPRDIYLSLMHARSRNSSAPAALEVIDAELRAIAPLAAAEFIVLEDYDNAASATLVGR